MSSWTAEVRRREAAARREERETQKEYRDLEKRIAARDKLSAWDQARLEVEAHENALEVLLSVHKQQSTPIEWESFVSALPPRQPSRSGRHEFMALLDQALIPNIADGGSAEIEAARTRDEREHKSALGEYQAKLAEWNRMRALAKRVLRGEPRAYSEAISEFSLLGEIAGIGSSLHVTIHSPKLLECVLTVNGREAIPAETKLLTKTGRLSTKPMPKARFHELYQDYVCGCVLRIAREMLALLPVDEVIVTALVHEADEDPALPVVSVAIPRDVAQRLDFEQLDPSESIESLRHRGDVKASQKSGAFLPILPLTPQELAPNQPERMDLSALLTHVRQLRAELAITSQKIGSVPSTETEAALSA